MTRLTAIRLLAKSELDRFLEQTITRLRWATIAALLLISLAQPAAGRARFPDWALVLFFAGYNLLADLVRQRTPGHRAFAWIAVLDLAAVGLVYASGTQPGGPLFTLFVLAAAQTTAFMTLAGGLLYTAVLGSIAALVEPTLPGWNATVTDARAMTARLVVLGLVGVGMGTLTRRLASEQDAARTMVDAATRLEELDRLRADFVASVSHDLRTPLTATRAALGLLDTTANDRLSPDERDWLANARRNVGRLGLLIDDLLAHNQLAAGTLRLDREPLDIRSVVAEAVAAVFPLIRAKDQTLELDLPEALPCQGDSGRLEQVVMNVLANAHYHTPPGTRIAVSGRVVADEIAIEIRDDGPGIPAAEAEAVFTRFYRLSPEGGGSGLGLAIARGLVELHGGRIWVESAEEYGASFRIALPVSQPTI